MSESQPSRVFMFDDDDPQMQQAYRNAQDTFRYFWREVAWERRRIIPALDLACVKAAFSDGAGAPRRQEGQNVEQMWVGEIDFDGQLVSGVLLNAPNWLTSIQEGDSVSLPLDQITDWMYTMEGEVYGAYTVNLMRSRMGEQERQEHDDAWGLSFGDPSAIRVVPQGNRSGEASEDATTQEHPMSAAMASSLQDRLAEDPSLVHATDDRGWTLLHQEALAGSVPTVRVLLEHGADPDLPTNDGKTALQLARSLGWEDVVSLLVSRSP